MLLGLRSRLIVSGEMPMGLAEQMFEGMCEKDPQGRDVFFPFMRFVRGRVIVGEENLARLKRNLKWLVRGQILLYLVVVAMADGLAQILLLCLPIFVCHQIIVICMVRHYPISDANPSGRPMSFQRMSNSCGARTLWVGIVSSLLFASVIIVGQVATPQKNILWRNYCFVGANSWCGVL